MKTVNNTTRNKLIIVARETHVAHNRTDIKDPSPIISLFEYVIGLFNEWDFEYFNRMWNYESALRLRGLLEEYGFKPIYMFEDKIYEYALFVKVTDNLYAILVPPCERDSDVPVVHPVYIYTADKRIELPFIAKIVTSFWLEKIRWNGKITQNFKVWERINDGLDEVIIEFDFEKRKARCKRIPVYKTRKDKLLASSL